MSAYSIYPYGGADSYFPTATLLLPSLRGVTNYLAVNAWAASKLGSPTLQIVANDDDTEVPDAPRRWTSADGVGVTGAGRGARQTWTLSRARSCRSRSPTRRRGSPIEDEQARRHVRRLGVHVHPGRAACAATRPSSRSRRSRSGVVVRARAVPSAPRFAARDHGSARRSAVALRRRGRRHEAHVPPSAPPGAPETLAAGQVVTFLTDSTRHGDEPGREDIPFHASVFMTGATYAGSRARRDPRRSRLRQPRPFGAVPGPVRLLCGLHVSGDDPHARSPQDDREGLLARHARVRRRDHRLDAARGRRPVRVRLGPR